MVIISNYTIVGTILGVLISVGFTLWIKSFIPNFTNSQEVWMLIGLGFAFIFGSIDYNATKNMS
jgi:ABC-type lipoprotein release transport system permease subunit